MKTSKDPERLGRKRIIMDRLDNESHPTHTICFLKNAKWFPTYFFT